MDTERDRRSGPAGTPRWRTESIGRFQLGALLLLIATSTALKVLWTWTSIDRTVLVVAGIDFFGCFLAAIIEIMSRATGLTRRQALAAPFRQARDEGP